MQVKSKNTFTTFIPQLLTSCIRVLLLKQQTQYYLSSHVDQLTTTQLHPPGENRKSVLYNSVHGYENSLQVKQGKIEDAAHIASKSQSPSKRGCVPWQFVTRLMHRDICLLRYVFLVMLVVVPAVETVVTVPCGLTKYLWILKRIYNI